MSIPELPGAHPSMHRGNTLHRSSVHYRANSLVQTIIHIHTLGQLKSSILPDLHVFETWGGKKRLHREKGGVIKQGFFFIHPHTFFPTIDCFVSRCLTVSDHSTLSHVHQSSLLKKKLCPFLAFLPDGFSRHLKPSDSTFGAK